MTKITLLLLLIIAPLTALAESLKVITGVAATVNGKVITRKEVAIMLQPNFTVIRAKYPRWGEQAQKELEEAEEKVLEQLIENKIILSELEDRGASIPDYVVDQEISRIVKNVYGGNEAKFRKTLVESGTTMRSFRESHREKILVQALKSEQFSGQSAPPTPSEISEQYRKRKHDFRKREEDKITFSKIFVPANSGVLGQTADAQLDLAEKIVEDLKDGADFAMTARKFSADAYSDEGGEWPEMLRTDFEPSFAELLFDSPVGQVVGPFKDPRGFTIVKVHNKNYGPSLPMSKVKDRLVKEIESEKYQERYDRWIKTLKKKAIIDRRL